MIYVLKLLLKPCQSFICTITCCLFFMSASAQVNWQNVDSSFGHLPAGFHVYKTRDSLSGNAFIAYYAIADLKETALGFTIDTTLGRRLTPTQFFQKNNHPLLVVNTTFFSFATNQNLSAAIKGGKLVGYNIHAIPGRGKDTFTYRHAFTGALGISKNRKADIAWLYTDSSDRYAYAAQSPIDSYRDSISSTKLSKDLSPAFKKWKVETAVGGGPVLVQNSQVKISNNEEMKFNGKAINDKHPRTLIGYTADDQLIVMVIQGRFPGIADGATLVEEATLMQELGCVEALNLDGGGSSCMLINGKETITPSDKAGEQRPVPAVFIIKAK